MRTVHVVGLALAACVATTPALALDINSFRAEHHLPRLHVSAALARAAAAHARDMAARDSLDHDGFRARIAPLVKSAGAENVAWGCAAADCVYRVWAKSSGHRENMLMRNITHYGLASAAARNGRRYWALELGN
jgi:uncharacterized protein YkwD